MSKWEKVRLGDVCEIERGGSPRPIDKFITTDKAGVNWIKIGDTSPDSMYITGTKEKIIPEGMKKSRYVQAGDFLLSNSMSFGRPYILKINGCIHDGWLVLRDKMNYFEKEYLYYALSSKTTYRKFKMLAVGGVVNNLNSSIVKQVEFPLSPLEVQKKIAKTLDAASELIALRKKQLAELDHLIKATFYDMFGDPVVNEKGWEVKKLGSVGELARGISKHRPRNAPELLNGKYPLIQTGDVANAGLYITSYKQTYSDLGLEQSKMWEKGTLCITIAANIAKTAILNFNACFPDSIVGFKPYKLANVFFINIWFSFFQKILEEQAPESAQKNINLRILSDLDIIIPPLHFQNRFAQIVAKVEEQKALVQKSIDESQYLFDSLMSQYFE
ncbi:MAG: restriction endonuclease subunit S [Phycisphaerales bacterium]